MPENGSPIYAVIKNIIEHFQISNNTILYSYKCPLHFDFLWNLMGTLPLNPENISKTFVIVWDGMPARNSQDDFANTSKYLTPIDWAIGLSLSVQMAITNHNEAQHEYPDLKILIFTPEPQITLNTDAIRLVEQFPRRDIKYLPWVRIFSPGHKDKVNNIDAFFNTLIDTDNLIPSMNKSFNVNEGKPDLDILKNIWASILTRPSELGDHHALANIVGPILLRKKSEPDRNDSHVTALLHLMKATGLLPTNESKTGLLTSNNPWINWKMPFGSDYIKHLMQEKAKLSCILIDDQIKNGWDKILRMALGADRNDNILVKSFDTAEYIIQKIERIFNTDQIDHRFNLSFADTSNEPEVLFLDLRLFSGVGVDKEVEYFKRLIPLAKMYAEDGIKKFPWKGFKKKEIEQVEKWIKPENRKRESNDYITALTFLPRILALTDLSLPIIIFSSTGRRDITEKFKEYENIITVFDKPKFTVDVPFDIAKQTKVKFQEAMKKALEILQGREICRKVQQLSVMAHNSDNLVPDGLNIPPVKHIEIYIDETGNFGQNTFSIGGIIIAYPEYDDVFKLDKDLKNSGLYWYSSDQNDTMHLSKRPNMQNELFQGKCANIDWTYEDAANIIARECRDKKRTDKKCFVSAVCIDDILGSYNNPYIRHFPLKDMSKDGRYVRVLSLILELVLFEIIPKWTNNNITVSIFPCTRITPVELEHNQTLSHSEDPSDYFGFGKAHTEFGKPQYYYTISTDSIVSFVANVINSRQDLPANITIHHSRGVSLTYGIPTAQGNIQRWDKIRVQNYFSDIVIGNKALFEKQFDVGFNTKADANLYTLFEAQHELLNDNLPAALELICSCKYVEDEMDKVHAHITKKIAQSIDTISGSNYMRICKMNALEEDDFMTESDRQTITIKTANIVDKKIKFVCIDESDKQILIGSKQTQKLGPDALKLREGDVIEATIVAEGDILYGRNLKII